MEKENVILKKSFDFALKIIEFSEVLEEARKFVIAKQLLKSGTSIGANIREAQSAESRSDFIHKMKIALKEAEETEYWLLLCKHSKNYPFYEELASQITEILKLLTSITHTAKSNRS
jgi:four helix bundle protein